MPRVSVLGVKDKMDFPDDMSPEAIRELLRRKFSQERMSFTNPDLTPQPQRIEAYEPSLREKMSSGISGALQKSGLVSDNYRANKTGENLTQLAEFIPGIGDAVDANDFGVAAASGDIGGMAMAGLGVIPVVGDVAQGAVKGIRKTVTDILPSGKSGADIFKDIKLSDPFAKAEKLPSGEISVKYRQEYQPKQVSKNNDYLYEFEPDALNLTETQFKDVSDYKGDPSKPISVTKKGGDYYILDGHHRAKIAKESGKNVKAVVIPEKDFIELDKKGIHQGDMLKEWIASGKLDKSPSIKDKFPDLKIGISESPESIILDKIVIPENKRGAGIGSSFMKQLIQEADKKGKTIGLTPSSDFGGSKKRLTEFYKRFGFIENKGRNKDFTIQETMIRPKSTD